MGQQTLLEPVIAQSAFLDNSFVSQPRTRSGFFPGVIVIRNYITADLPGHFLMRSRAVFDQGIVISSPMAVGNIVMTRDDAVWAHGYACLASDTLGGCMHGDIAISFVHCPGWTPFCAWSILALVAECGDELESDIGEFADSPGLPAGPGDTSLKIVLTLAGNDTSSTPGTALEVYYHGKPLAFRRTCCRSGPGG